jgi:hypothetical protein
MPIHHTILQSYNLLYVSFEGDTTFADVQQSRNAVRADPDFHDNLNELADLRSGSLASLSTENLSQLGATITFNHGVKRAFVVAHDRDYGLLRMYQVFAERHHHQIRIFRSLEEACEWLQIPISALPTE